MVVDPATGLPIEEGVAPQSLLGAYGTSVGQSAGLQTPLYYDMMESIPSASTTVAWNMNRVQNAVFKNNRGRAGAFRQTFSPTRFGSLADVANIDPVSSGVTRPKLLSRGQRRAAYTPFNALSNVGNWGYGKTASGQALAANNQRAFAPGALGTLATGSTLMAGGGAVSASRAANVVSATSRIAGPGADMAKFARLSQNANVAGGFNRGTFLATGFDAARLGNAKYTGKAVGYYRGAQAARLGTTSSANLAVSSLKAGGSFYDEGLKSGAKAFRAGGAGARLAGSRAASIGLRAAGPIGTALLVRDISMAGGRLVGRTMKLGVDSVKSAQGDLTKSGFGALGYRDNSVAATSRQRGVMAISNSRLNARSALGQEAAYMHSSFG